MHEEMPKRGPSGKVDGFQLWVNLPAAEKMSRPRYQEVAAETIPTVAQDGARVRVVAGEFGGIIGPVTQIAAKPLYMDVTLDAATEITLPVPVGHSAVAYLFEGGGLFGMDEADHGDPVEAVSMVVFGDGDHVRIQAGLGSAARFMWIAGAPFNEPIAPYGPFVMNTREEIMQALADLRNGTFVQD
jgi:redox-sensitive bicupin YhaK (pirin superfamily)